MPTDPDHPYVGRGGLKLEHALRTFQFDVTALRCADFGCNVGGFTDCLLRHGAAHVTAIDTGYGTLDYKLRTDDRVTVMERTNILHMDPPTDPVDLVVADVGWTRQERIIPAALAWLGGRPEGKIISLIKPHYELSASDWASSTHPGKANRHVLADGDAQQVAQRIATQLLPTLGVRVLGFTQSPIRGGATRGRKTGNIEFLALLAPSSDG